MGLGGGAIKSNVSPLIGEQYTGKMRKKTLKSGEVVIVSPSVTYQRIYNWYVCDSRNSTSTSTHPSSSTLTGSTLRSTGAQPAPSRLRFSLATTDSGRRSSSGFRGVPTTLMNVDGTVGGMYNMSAFALDDIRMWVSFMKLNVLGRSVLPRHTAAT